MSHISEGEYQSYYDDDPRESSAASPLPEEPRELKEALDGWENLIVSAGYARDFPTLQATQAEGAAARAALVALFERQRAATEDWHRAAMASWKDYVDSLSRLERLKAEQLTPEEAKWLADKVEYWARHTLDTGMRKSAYAKLRRLSEAE